MQGVQQSDQAGYRFDRLLVREVVFRDATTASEPAPLGTLSIDLGINTTVAEDRGWCACKLRVSVQNGPFSELSATVEGRFVVEGPAVTVEIEEFARTHAPAILMPFARAEIAQATRASRFGQVLLPPINVVAITEAMEPSEKHSSK